MMTRLEPGNSVTSATAPQAGGIHDKPQPNDAYRTRSSWLALLLRVATPPLAALASGRLREGIPSQGISSGETAAFACLEAIGRTLTGLAPWLALSPDSISSPDELRVQAELRSLVTAALAEGLNPVSPQALNFTSGNQPLVDTAFLAHAVLRAPSLFHALDAVTRERFIQALCSTRVITPLHNNWILFSAMIEATLLNLTGEGDLTRIDYAVRQHEQWYVGDGMYSDGPRFHWDYYNSFVIQPMFLDVLETAIKHAPDNRWNALLPAVRQRAIRQAAILERLVAPDGSFPSIGRSITYRCGAFHHLAAMALRQELPPGLTPAAVRCALTAVIRRTLEAPGTFDARGWLRTGLSGSQPGLGENYISTGSLYLCTTAFLPLGLPVSDPFWCEPDCPHTSIRIWRGEDFPADHALHP
ncbi:MAG: DUF2264 domain-containing protein [Opitutaceae bacterium]|jgi:hypothetical protein|nr:DUF2264 domain-containing protein [Opitutaceae bacterium]